MKRFESSFMFKNLLLTPVLILVELFAEVCPGTLHSETDSPLLLWKSVVIRDPLTILVAASSHSVFAADIFKR